MPGTEKCQSNTEEHERKEMRAKETDSARERKRERKKERKKEKHHHQTHVRYGAIYNKVCCGKPSYRFERETAIVVFAHFFSTVPTAFLLLLVKMTTSPIKLLLMSNLYCS